MHPSSRLGAIQAIRGAGLALIPIRKVFDMTELTLASEGLYPPKKGPDPSLRRLASGILIQAFRDILTSRKESRECIAWREDALEWFSLDDDYPGSFVWVCHVLNANSWRIREWLEEYRAANPTRRREMGKKLVGFQIPH